jgi:putative ABC transport system permease protein
MNVVQLSPVDLGIASLLILALAGLSWRMQIGSERQLLISALRSTVQLFLIGLVLKVLFDHAHPAWVALLAAVMLTVAGREVMVRQRRRFVGWWGFGASAPCQCSCRRLRSPCWRWSWSSAPTPGTHRSTPFRCSA